MTRCARQFLTVLLLCWTASLAAIRVSTQQTEPACKPRIALCGDRYCVVWLDSTHKRIMAARVNRDLSGEPECVVVDSVTDSIGGIEVASKGDTILVVTELLQSPEGGYVRGALLWPWPSNETIRFPISPLTPHHIRPTVAARADSFLVAWHNTAFDSIICRSVTARGGLGEPNDLIDKGDYPRLASDGVNFMLAYRRIDMSYEVWGWHARGGSVLEFEIYRDHPFSNTPDIAYNPDSETYLVAVRNALDTLVVRPCDSVGPSGPCAILAQDGLSDSLAVAASEQGFFVVFQKREGQPPNDSCHVLGQRVDATGLPTGPLETVVIGSQEVDHHDPHVASDGRYYAVVWQQLDGESSAVYIDTVPAYLRYFYSRSEYATAFNQSRHIARDPGNGELHVVYVTRGLGPEAVDSVLYVHSTNDGEDWFPYEYVGAGRYSAVIVNDVGGGLGPWVAYVTADGSLVQAIRHGEGDWSYDTIFDAHTVEQSAGPPSYAPCYLAPQEDVPAACAVYPVYISSGNCEIHFSVSTQLGVEYDTVLRVSSTADFPCVAVTPGDIAHVSWQEGEEAERAIYYMAYGEGGWSDTVRVSTPAPQEPTSEPADHASLEAYGDFVYCVWRGPAYPGDIWRSSRWLQNEPNQWDDPDTQNCTADRESDYPVMVTNFATVWHEEMADPSYDVWARFEEGEPGPLFVTGHQSCFPHVAGYWASDTFHCLTVWTEATDDSGVFAVTFGDHVWEPLYDGGFEPGSFYAVEVGEPKPSPYCTRRGGFKEYRSCSVDSAAGELVYRLPYLNPRCSYLLRAVFYHEGKETWTAELRGDSSLWAKVTARPNVPETVWVRVPRETYRKDTRVEFSLRRVSGGFVSLAGLKLFQREFQDKGYELAVFGGRAQSVRTLRASPSPFTERTSICYSLAAPGRARVDILDATGRVVCKLVDADLAAGEHRVSWSGRDEQGRAVAAGVYFCTLQAPDAAAIDRIVLLR